MTTLLRPLAAALAAALLFGGCATRATAPVQINLVGMNDFHGHLDPSKFENNSIALPAPQSMQAGGIENIAAALQAWRLEDKDLLVVGAGDMVGASPAMSSMWADEPTIAALGMAGLFATSVGNHEFDQGRAELLRQQNGGCVSIRPDKACKFGPEFQGAGYTYLAANVLDKATGKPFLPAYRIADVKGVKVGFIGAVLKDTASVVLASGIVGLSFVDEADAINQVMPELRAKGAKVFVVLIHEGGQTSEPFDKADCSQLQGPIVGIVKRLDPAIRLIISGHTHKGFQCKVDGRTVTQAEMGGHVLSRISMQVDPSSGVVLDIKVRNTMVKAGLYPPHQQVEAFLKMTRARSKQALLAPLAKVSARSMTRKASPAGESALGDLIADAVLASARAQGAQIGFMNAGGLRQDLDVGEDMTASFGQVQIVLPFGNTIVSMDLTGAELRDVLEQQFVRLNGAHASVLQVSNGFSYSWDASKAPGQRVVPGSLMLNGTPIEDKRTYRVAANNFLAEGGDNFFAFAKARNKIDSQVKDMDAVIGYLVKHDEAGTPAGIAAPAGRIQVVGTPQH